MGCTSSTQTTAQDTTRPNTKEDGSTSGTSNENGGPAADSETIPDQTHAAESPQTSSAAPVPSEEIQSSTAAVAHNEPEVPSEPAESNPSMTAENTEEPAPSGTSNENGGPAADSETAVAHNEPEVTSEPAESDPSMTAENTEEPAPSENTTEDQADSSPPEEAPASGEDS